MFPDIHLWNCRHQFSGNNVSQCYLSCNNHCASCLVSLGSGVASKCWNGMSQRPLGQAMVLTGRQCQHQPPATAEYTGHISCQELTLARQCLWQKPASPCLPAGTSRRGQERRQQIKGEAEQLVTHSWQLSPGFPADLSNRAPFQAPAQLTAEWEGAVHVYADAKKGRQAGN